MPSTKKMVLYVIIVQDHTWVYILGISGRGGGMAEKSPWGGRKMEFHTFSKNYPIFLHKNAIIGCFFN